MNQPTAADYRTKVLLGPERWSSTMTHEPTIKLHARTFNLLRSMKSSISEADAQARGNVRTGLTADEIKQAFRDNLVCGMGRLEATATKHDLYMALALTVRDRVLQRTVTSMERYGGADARRVAYLSAEFLLGPHLANNMLNLGMIDAAREAMSALGHDLEEILAQEEEPGLGNGGLGRLAACYMDSLSSVEVLLSWSTESCSS